MTQEQTEQVVAFLRHAEELIQEARETNAEGYLAAETQARRNIILSLALLAEVAAMLEGAR